MSSKKELNGAAETRLKLAALSLPEVERLATGAYRVRGYEVRAIPPSEDGAGGDLLLTKGTQRLLLQCRYWNARKVGEMPVRELYGAMAGHSANGGILISNGSFTLEATRFAGFGGIELLDGSSFRAVLQRPSSGTNRDSPGTNPRGLARLDS